MRGTYCVLPFLLAGCALNPPIHTQSGRLDQYQFVLIESTGSVTSLRSSGGTRSVNPSQLIEGILLKKGLVKISEPVTQTSGKLLLARYGISAKRDIAGGLVGYAQEVTISLVDAESMKPIFTCTAEGIGATEADDIRDAITNCMAGLK